MVGFLLLEVGQSTDLSNAPRKSLLAPARKNLYFSLFQESFSEPQKAIFMFYLWSCFWPNVLYGFFAPKRLFFYVPDPILWFAVNLTFSKVVWIIFSTQDKAARSVLPLDFHTYFPQQLYLIAKC